MDNFYPLLAASIINYGDDSDRMALYCCAKQFYKLSPASKSKTSSCFLYVANNFGKSNEEIKCNPIRFFLQDQSFDVRPNNLLRLVENLTQEKATIFGNSSNQAIVEPSGSFVCLFTRNKAEKIFFPSFFWALEASLKKGFSSVVSLMEFKYGSQINDLLSKLRFTKLHPIMADIDVMRTSTASQLQLNIDHLVNQKMLTLPAPIAFSFNNKRYNGAVMGNNSGGYSFLYKPAEGAPVGSKIPSAFIQKVVATDEPNASTKGKNWQSLFYHGRSLSSLRSECERNMFTIELKMIPGVTRAAIANGKVTAYSKMDLEELKASPMSALLRSKYIDLKHDDHNPKPESMHAVTLKPHFLNETEQEKIGYDEATLGCFMTDGDDSRYALTAGHVVRNATEATSILKLDAKKETHRWKIFCKNVELDYACLKLIDSKEPSVLHIQGLKCNAIEKEQGQTEASSSDDDYTFPQDTLDEDEPDDNEDDIQEPANQERSSDDFKYLASLRTKLDGIRLELDPLAINYKAIGEKSEWTRSLFKVGIVTGVTVGYIQAINERNVFVGSYSCLPPFSDTCDSGSLYFTYYDNHVLPLAIHRGGEHVREGVRLDVIVKDIKAQTNVDLNFCAYYEDIGKDEEK